MLFVACHVSSRPKVYLIKQALTKQAAGTAKMIRMFNKYGPRAFGAPLAHVRSGFNLRRQVERDIDELPFSKSFKDVLRQRIRRIVPATDWPAASIVGPNGGSIHLRNKTPEKLNSQDDRYSTPVSVLGHEGVHAGMRRPFRDRATVRKLTSQAQKVLGPHYAGAKAYQKSTSLIQRALNPIFPSNSEVSADAGGKLFDEWMRKNNPRAYEIMDQKMKRLLAPKPIELSELWKHGLPFAPRSKQERMKQLLKDRNSRRATEIINRLGLDKD